MVHPPVASPAVTRLGAHFFRCTATPPTPYVEITVRPTTNRRRPLRQSLQTLSISEQDSSSPPPTDGARAGRKTRYHRKHTPGHNLGLLTNTTQGNGTGKVPEELGFFLKKSVCTLHVKPSKGRRRQRAAQQVKTTSVSQKRPLFRIV